MRHLKKLTLEEIESIYNTHLVNHFPPMEVKPLKSIVSMCREGKYDAYGLFEDRILLGYAYLVGVEESVRLLDYLAVLPEYRSQGAGGQILSALRAHAKGQVILIETENPERADNEEERAMQQRRNRFYEKNGAVLTGLRTEIFTVPFYIWQLADGRVFSDSDCERAITEIYRYMVSEPHYSAYVKIPE